MEPWPQTHVELAGEYTHAGRKPEVQLQSTVGSTHGSLGLWQ
jgi:hypothetical protein